MIQLIMDNIFIEVRNASREIEHKLWDILSFQLKEFNTNSFSHPTIRHLFNRKTKLTYAGLLPYIQEVLNDNDEDYEIIDNRVRPEQNANFKLVDYLDEEKTIPFKLRDYQENILQHLRPRDIVQCATGGGKALAVSTLILTPIGFKQLKDIHPGDIIFDEDGNKTKVLAEYPQGFKDEYEVIFQDGTKIKCCKDHLWKYTAKTQQFDNYKVESLEQIMKYKMSENNYITIPVNKPIQFDRQDLTIEPYMLGCLLKLVNSLNQIEMYKVPWENLEKILNKYLISSIEDRIDLLRGLVDYSDGYTIFSTDNLFLKNSAIFLSRSLGYRPIIEDNKIIINDNFTLDKEQLIKRINNRHDILKIIDIKKLDTQVEMKCLTVDSPKHTYICEDFIVTHNTTMLAGAIAKFNTKPVTVLADKLSLCQQLQSELSKFLGEDVGLVGSGINDRKDITVYSVQSATQEMVKDTKVLLCDECLVENTVIQLANGVKKTIGWLVNERDIEKTYRIVSYNHETGERENKTILNFYKIVCDKPILVIIIKTDKGIRSVTCTDNHQFYVKFKNTYVEAKELEIDDEVITRINNEFYPGRVFKIVKTPKKYEYVYDLEVEDNHNFFANDILVHNCHHTPANTIAQIARWCTDAYYRVGVSATPWRDDNSDLLIDAVFSRKNEDLSISASNLIERGYLVPCHIYWVHQKEVFKNKNYQSLYIAAVVNNNNRNRNIVTIAYQMRKYQNATILILVQRVEHGNMLLNMLREVIPDKFSIINVTNSKSSINRPVNVHNIEFLSGQDDTNRRLAVLDAVKNKKCNILIATSVADEGLDLPALDCLILGGAGKSSTRALQRIGRILRLYTDPNTGQKKKQAIVFDFMDYTPMLMRHSKSRNKIYSKETLWTIDNFPDHLLANYPPKITK